MVDLVYRAYRVLRQLLFDRIGRLYALGIIAMLSMHVYHDYYIEEDTHEIHILFIMGMAFILAGMWSNRKKLEHINNQIERGLLGVALSHKDYLTGLPSRVMLMDRMHHAIVRAKDHNLRMAVIFTDISRLKHVNETMGHAAGDAILVEVGKRLVALVGDNDTVSRCCGDQFVILIPHVKHEMDITELVQKMLTVVKEKIVYKEMELYVTSNAGVVYYPDGALTVDALLRRGDKALFQAKQSGGGFVVFENTLEREGISSVVLERDLRVAIHQNQLVPYYQPQFEMGTHKFLGCEVLVRWDHPTLGLVSPAKFLPLAEEINIMDDIDKWMFDAALKQFRVWLDNGYHEFVMAFNVNPGCFASEDMIPTVTGAAAKYQIRLPLIEVEITEHTLMENTNIATCNMDGLCDRGVSIAIDDFGTGYSSMKYLQHFPVQKLKIDRSFVSGIGLNTEESIIQAILQLGDALGIAVLAEGVETKEQYTFLAEHGCYASQGFLCGPPCDAETFEKSYLDEPCGCDGV